MKQPEEAYNEILTILDNFILKTLETASNWAAHVQTQRQAMVNTFKLSPITYKQLKVYVTEKLIVQFIQNDMTSIESSEFNTLRNALLRAVDSWPNHEDYLEWQVKQLTTYAANLKTANITLTEQLELINDVHAEECLHQVTLMSIKDNAIETLSEQLTAALTQIHELTINPSRNYLSAATSSLNPTINIRTSPVISTKQQGHHPTNYKR